MKIVKGFFDKDTGKKISYNDEERYQGIIGDWLIRNKEEDLQRYTKYLPEFNIVSSNFKNAVIVDIGCGPWGGVLRYFPQAKKRIAVDVLIDRYIKAGIFECDDEYLIDNARKIRLPDNHADFVFCLNTLDHCAFSDSPQRIIKEIYRILKPRGNAFIYMHMRDEDYLNVLHLYSLEEEDLKKYFRHFQTIRWAVKKDTVWDTPHKTFWGVFEK